MPVHKDPQTGEIVFDTPGLPVVRLNADGSIPAGGPAPNLPGIRTEGETRTVSPNMAGGVPDFSPMWDKMTPDERQAASEQSKVRGQDALAANPKPYDGQLADVFGMKVYPEEALGIGHAMGGVGERLQSGAKMLKDSGSFKRAAGAMLERPTSGFLSRMYDALFGEGAPESVERVTPPGMSTGTKFGPPDVNVIKPTPKPPLGSKGYANSKLEISRSGAFGPDRDLTDLVDHQTGGVNVTGSAVRHNVSDAETVEEAIRRIMSQPTHVMK